ncbi:MAG: hypothetical protein MHM6MM_008781, partial [Cercozoa sp. M6MM]
MEREHSTRTSYVGELSRDIGADLETISNPKYSGAECMRFFRATVECVMTTSCYAREGTVQACMKDVAVGHECADVAARFRHCQRNVVRFPPCYRSCDFKICFRLGTCVCVCVCVCVC